MATIVIGASGGIGSALADVLETRGEQVNRLSRRDGTIDLLDENSIALAAASLAGGAGFSRILVATGVLHGDGLSPERNLRELSAERLLKSFEVNAVGPALAARHFLPLLEPDGRFAALSARVGSISDNRLGGWYGYRASKAALNQLVRTAAIELARTRPHAICVTLHPGTVDTHMSRPFQRGVAAEKLFEPRLAAERLIDVLDSLRPEDSGDCFDWSGARVPF